jgi:hypothetical protein
VDRAAADSWIRAQVDVAGPIDTWHERPWATVLRVPVATGVVWFKACAPIQAFEPRLTAELFTRWPDRVTEVLADDQARGWLLLADAGKPIREFGNPPEIWLAALPLYAELQRGEAAHAHDHLAHGVPDLRVPTLPARYEGLLRRNLPLEPEEILRLREFGTRFADSCDQLAALGIPESVQHDDLHAANIYTRDRLRILDWGDSSISHPFMSLVVTYRFLEETNHLSPRDPWFARLRDAYLEPWGGGDLVGTFDLAIRVGAFAHAIAWARQRDALPASARAEFDEGFAIILRRAVARTA